MLEISSSMIHYFKGFCSSAEVIMLFVSMKCRFSISYRDLEEMMQIRGAFVDHSTLIDEYVNEKCLLMAVGEWMKRTSRYAMGLSL